MTLNDIDTGLEGVRGLESGGTIGKAMKIETALRNAAENHLKKTMFLGEGEQKLAEDSACDDTAEGGYQAISVGEQGVDVDSDGERCVNVRCDVLSIKYEQKLAIEYIVTVDKKNQKVITFRNTDRKENTNNTKQPIKMLTKLKNVLYGWRVCRTVTNNQVKPQMDIFVEQVSLSA